MATNIPSNDKLIESNRPRSHSNIKHQSPEDPRDPNTSSPKPKKNMFDISHFKYKALNVLRDCYSSTAEGFSSISRLFNDNSSDLLWLLGTVYVNIDEKRDSSLKPHSNSSVNSHSTSSSDSPSGDSNLDTAENNFSLPKSQSSTDFTKFESLIDDQQAHQSSRWGFYLGKLSSISKPYPTKFVDRFQNLIWCTYRYNCRPLDPSNFTTDAGWGCMLRAGQTLLAQALQYHYFGKDYNMDWNNMEERLQYLKIIKMFIDDEHQSSICSIYRMSELGKTQGMSVGEWFGPNGTCNIIKNSDIPIEIYVTSDGVVRLCDIIDLPEGKFYSEILGKEFKEKNCMKPTLILVATRLGIDRVNPIYYNFIKFCLTVPQTVGIAGGKPSSALYFPGFDNNDLIYLDPHINKPAVEQRKIDEYCLDDIISYRCTSPKKINISKIDPCMFFGFYIHDIYEFVDFYKRIISLDNKGISNIIQFSFEKTPSDQNIDLGRMSLSSKDGKDNILQTEVEDEDLDDWVI
ncbi:hypothetical protein BB560_001890 [Smittium megazygosporum]|uniref:Cysteine protease n=1 Tax=Smittium megazygosporum TaxID=133381 RepID=A0A2T9ZGH7_9FUNG|nr:hypothetical protein BB560_001890 [Smittium megazygosporum]